jgi:hypothetical protein
MLEASLPPRVAGKAIPFRNTTVPKLRYGYGVRSRPDSDAFEDEFVLLFQSFARFFHFLPDDRP